MTILDEVLGRWQTSIAGHRPEEVAALFTSDAVFQGLHPYSVGRSGVAEYYDSQPLGMTVAYRILSERALGEATVGWIEAEFSFVCMHGSGLRSLPPFQSHQAVTNLPNVCHTKMRIHATRQTNAKDPKQIPPPRAPAYLGIPQNNAPDSPNRHRPTRPSSESTSQYH